MDHDTSGHPPISLRAYLLVWAALLVLTWITVTVARINLGGWSVFTALAIASVKSVLVLLFFMHLKYERPLFQIMFLVAVVTLSVFIGLTFLDIAYR